MGIAAPNIPFTIQNPLGQTFNVNAVITAGGGGTTNGGATCWPNFGGTTTSYRANVTAAISPLQPNGNYVINGLPANINVNPGTDTDGATLLIVYSNPCTPNSRPATFFLYDGLSMVDQPGGFNLVFAGSPYGALTAGAQIVFGIGDVQTNNNTTVTYGNAPTNFAIPTPPQMWQTINNNLPGPYNPNIPFSHVKGGTDCSAIGFWGVYYQNGNVNCGNPVVSIAPQNQQFCQTGNVTFTQQLTSSVQFGTPGYSYSWSPATGLSCTTCANPIATFSATTSYTLLVTDANSCTGTATVTLTVNPPPPAVIIGPDYNSCDGIASVYTVSNPQTGVTYSWFVDYTYSGASDFPASGTTVTVPWENEGWTITLTTCLNSNPSCCSTSSVFVDRCCPCDVNPPNTPYCFNNTNANIYGNSLVSAGNDYIVINGIMTVPAGITVTFTGFDGMNGTNDIRLGTNGKIIVQPNATLIIDDCLMQLCAKMWDGIFLTDVSSKIIITNGSRITYAKNAIVSNQGGIFEVDNTIFDNNYKGIVVNTFNGTHQGFVRTTTFNNSVPFGPGVATPPLPGNAVRSDVGIEVNSVKDITIGNPALAAYLNTFNNLDFGIRSNSCQNIKVFNNRFQNMSQGVPAFSGVGIYAIGNSPSDPPQNTIIVGGPNNFELNRFFNCMHGIYATNTINLTAKNNILTNTAFNGIDGITCALSPDVNIDITDNRINRYVTGIWCLDNAGATINIESNDINLNAPTAFVYLYGIRMENAVLAGVNANVRLNNIRACRNGVYMINYTTFAGNRPRIRFNNIGIELNNNQVALPLGPVFGIRVVSSPGAFVDVNDVTRMYNPITAPAVVRYNAGPIIPPALNLQMVGIYVQNSANSTVSNNNIAKMGSGVIMDAQNPGCKLTCNNFYRNRYAFYFGPTGPLPYYTGITNIGASQFGGLANDNVYRSAITVPAFAPSLSGCDLIGTVTTNTWLYRSLPNYTPSGLPGCTPIGMTMSAVGSLSQTACDPISPPLAPPILRQNAWQGIAQSSIIYQQFNSENQMNSKRIAYRNFKDSLQMLTLNTFDDSIYQGFYYAQANTPVGQFETVLDNIYSGNISNAVSINSGISTNNNIEYYRKAVNAIYLATWAQGIRGFSSNDSAFLLTVANGDPIEWGDAVYSAQVMVGFYPIAPSPLREMGTENEDEMHEGYIYPNPNDGNMMIKYSIEGDAELQITDITGKLMCSYKLLAEDSKIDISCDKLSNGIYLYKIINGNEIIKANKIMIIK
ncbi:MAG: T9SS type A sorting domain-containing protein [Bacteroidota bacterium]